MSCDLRRPPSIKIRVREMKYFHKEINFYDIGHEIVSLPASFSRLPIQHTHKMIKNRTKIKRESERRGKKLKLISIVYVFHSTIICRDDFTLALSQYQMRMLTTKMQFYHSWNAERETTYNTHWTVEGDRHHQRDEKKSSLVLFSFCCKLLRCSRKTMSAP